MTAKKSKTTSNIGRDPNHKLNHHRKAGPMTSRGKPMTADEIIREQIDSFTPSVCLFCGGTYRTWAEWDAHAGPCYRDDVLGKEESDNG